MALPNFGVPLGISQINVELGRASNAANSNLKTLAGLAKAGSTPKINENGSPAISHWYGYTHTQVAGSVFNFASTVKTLSGQNADFNTARTTVSISRSDYFTGCGVNTAQASRREIYRIFLGFDCTAITSATAANITINFPTNQNAVSQTYALVGTTPARAYNYQWTTANYTECLGTPLYATAGINVGVTGNLVFNLNAAGLSYINSNNSCTFAIIQHNNDYSNTTTGLQSRSGVPALINTGTTALAQLSYS